MRQMLSTEAFLEWIEKRPAGRRYEYDSTYGCAWATYLQEMGVQKVVVGEIAWYVMDPFSEREQMHHLPPGMAKALKSRPHTYGALAKRVRALP